MISFTSLLDAIWKISISAIIISSFYVQIDCINESKASDLESFSRFSFLHINFPKQIYMSVKNLHIESAVQRRATDRLMVFTEYELKLFDDAFCYEIINST